MPPASKPPCRKHLWTDNNIKKARNHTEQPSSCMEVLLPDAINKQIVSPLPTGYNERPSLCRHQQNSAFGVVPLASDIPCEKSFAGYTKISTQSWISTNHKRILVITWESRLPGSLCCSQRHSHCTRMMIIHRNCTPLVNLHNPQSHK